VSLLIGQAQVASEAEQLAPPAVVHIGHDRPIDVAGLRMGSFR